MAENYPEIEEVWLFGSLARGDATPGSDADLMVLVSECSLPFLERPLRYQPDFCGLGMDLLIYTRAEAMQMEKDGHPLFRTVYTEGVPLFQRTEVVSSAKE
ncbi:MAG: nucleotidyltransferase domain-containing protein [Caldilinea sp.]|nr:nucleotidyltransferase domain-containing protein [Caldilinea sp.]MDW8440884.1 nucleotidyltransferase domain-containing protein [Caldilineaceae bacterium]